MKKMKKSTVVRNAVIGVGLCAVLVGGAGLNYCAVIGDEKVAVIMSWAGGGWEV